MSWQALWFYCQPPMAAMQLLASVAAAAAEGALRGAALIDLLVERRARVNSLPSLACCCVQYVA